MCYSVRFTPLGTYLCVVCYIHVAIQIDTYTGIIKYILCKINLTELETLQTKCFEIGAGIFLLYLPYNLKVFDLEKYLVLTRG